MANPRIKTSPTVNSTWRDQAQVFAAYLGLYTLLAGDSWRYLLGWFGWGGIAALIAVSTVYFLFANRLDLRRLPPIFLALVGLMALSTAWSNYPALTALATFSQIATSAFGILLAVAFSWNQLLKLLANTVRFILGLSLVFELYAAVIVQGPVSPIYKNYTGETPPSGAFYWTQAHLLTGQRIQGIVGNSNILAFVSMLGLVLFAIEFFASTAKKLIVVPSIFVATAMLALAKSAGIGFAIVAIIVVAAVVWLVRGKVRDERHRLYRFAWTGAGIAAFFVLLYRTEVFQLIGKSPDMSGRAGIWQSVLGLIQLRPVQ
ncbi:MAG: hypothetical protein RL670_1231, partial [Actinomycetota bacterium]